MQQISKYSDRFLWALESLWRQCDKFEWKSIVITLTLQFACLSVSKKPFPCKCTFALRPSNSTRLSPETEESLYLQTGFCLAEAGKNDTSDFIYHWHFFRNYKIFENTFEIYIYFEYTFEIWQIFWRCSKRSSISKVFSKIL